MRDLTPTKHYGRLHLIAIQQEALCVFRFCLKVMFLDVRPELDFFDLHGTLILFGFLFPLALLKAIFAVIHHPADRRFGIRGYLDQIQPFFHSMLQRFTQGQDHRVSLIQDQTDLRRPDLIIDA